MALLQKDPPDLATLADDIAALKKDLSALIDHTKTVAMDGGGSATQHALDRLSAEIHRLYETATAQGQRSAKVLTEKVEEQPLTSLLVAFAVGFLSSQIFGRR